MRKLAPILALLLVSASAQEYPSVPNIAERAEAGVSEHEELSCWIVSILESGVLINPDMIVARGGAVKVAMPARDHSRMFFIEGLPAIEAGLVDDCHCYAIVEASGVFQYPTEGGRLATVKAFRFVRFGKPSDRQAPTQ